jgi:hypothetical protein
MSKQYGFITLLCCFVLIGLALRSYLPLSSSKQERTNIEISPKLVKAANEKLYKIIQKNPIVLYRLDRFIASSPYLSSQKKVFLEKYYGQLKARHEEYNIKMLGSSIARPAD